MSSVRFTTSGGVMTGSREQGVTAGEDGCVVVVVTSRWVKEQNQGNPVLPPLYFLSVMFTVPFCPPPPLSLSQGCRLAKTASADGAPGGGGPGWESPSAGVAG